MQTLQELIYCAEIVPQPNTSGLYRIIDAAQVRNAESGISSVLAVSQTHFLQAIEGPPDAVRALFARIQGDLRCSSVQLLRERAITHRHWPGWSMGLVQCSPCSEPGGGPAACGPALGDASRLTGDAAWALLDALSARPGASFTPVRVTGRAPHCAAF